MHVESNMADEESGKKPQRAALYALSLRRVFFSFTLVDWQIALIFIPYNSIHARF